MFWLTFMTNVLLPAPSHLQVSRLISLSDLSDGSSVERRPVGSSCLMYKFKIFKFLGKLLNVWWALRSAGSTDAGGALHFWSVLNADIYGLADISVHVSPWLGCIATDTEFWHLQPNRKRTQNKFPNTWRHKCLQGVWIFVIIIHETKKGKPTKKKPNSQTEILAPLWLKWATLKVQRVTGLKGEFYWEQSRLITRKTDFAAKTEEKRDGGAGRFLWVCKSAPKLPPERPNWPKTTHTHTRTHHWTSGCLQDTTMGAVPCRMGTATPDWLRRKSSKLVQICNRWF